VCQQQQVRHGSVQVSAARVGEARFHKLRQAALHGAARR